MTPLSQNRNLLIVFSVTLMSVLGIATIYPVLPKVAAALNVPKAEIGKMLAFFTLPGLVLTPVLGVLADRYGRKRVLGPALLLFGLAGFASGFARNFEMMLTLRFLQGCGAASLGALNVTLIGDLFRSGERGRMMGYNNSVLSLGTATMPLIGGALATLAWYAPFFLPILALPIAWIVLSKLDTTEPDSAHAIGDYFRLLGSGMNNLKICGLFLISVNTFVILFGSFLTYLPFVLSQKFQLGPEKIGLMVCTMSFSQSLMATQLGRLLSRFSKKQILKIAFLLYMTAMLLFPNMPWVGLMLLPTVLFGMAQGVNVPTVQSMLADAAPLERRAAFMSINRWVSQIGQTLGPLFTGLVYANFGLNSVFYAGALVALTTFLIIFLFGAKGKDHPPV